MAEGNPSLNEDYENLQNVIKIFKINTGNSKQEINRKIDSLIETINIKKRDFLTQKGSELIKAKEMVEKYEAKALTLLCIKKELGRYFKRNDELIARLKRDIDEEFNNINVSLPNKFTRIGELKIYKQSRFEGRSTPLLSTLNRGKVDNELSEPKAIAIDPETSNIYVGDASAGKILIVNKMGEYLNTLKLKKPSSIRKMEIYQNYIYCRSNSLWHSCLFRLDKNTGEVISKYNDMFPFDAFTVLANEVYLCDSMFFILLLPDLTEPKEAKIMSPHYNNFSHVSNMKNVNDDLVLLVTGLTKYPIQIFDKEFTFLKAIAGEIPPLYISTDVYICIDEHWNIFFSVDWKELVNVYNKDGKFVTSVGQEEDKNNVYYPRGIALDTEGNLIVCNNRKKQFLQFY